MPKRAITHEVPLGAQAPSDHLRGWQTTGLALAAIAFASNSGIGTLLGAALFAPVITAFARLRAHSPTAASTPDLIAGTLGDRTATAIGLVQLTGYTVFVASVSQSLGLQTQILWWRALLGDKMPDLEALLTSWQWLGYSAAIAIAAGLLAHLLPRRVLATVAAVLVAAGLLIYFYLALAVIARVVAGTEPVQIGSQLPPTGLGLSTGLLLLALSVVGFESITTQNRRLATITWPMRLALALVAGCAMTVWLANYLGCTAGFHLNAGEFPFIVSEMYGSAGNWWLTLGTLAMAVAVLFALTSAAVNLAGRQYQRLTAGAAAGPAVASVLVGLVVVLVFALCRNWGGLTDKLTNVAPLLIVVLYVAVAEANSRLPGSGIAAQWLRSLTISTLVGALLLPLVLNEFSLAALWPPAIAAVVVALAFVTASVTHRRPHRRESGL